MSAITHTHGLTLKLGNYVMNRKTKEKKFEDMPIYVRIGMHLLFNQSYLSVSMVCGLIDLPFIPSLTRDLWG
jgi:hypothetical protein